MKMPAGRKNAITNLPKLRPWARIPCNVLVLRVIKFGGVSTMTRLAFLI
jgi:hypothetical protein